MIKRMDLEKLKIKNSELQELSGLKIVRVDADLPFPRT